MNLHTIVMHQHHSQSKTDPPEVEFIDQFEFIERLQKDCSDVFTTPAARHRTVTSLKTTIIAKELPCRW